MADKVTVKIDGGDIREYAAGTTLLAISREFADRHPATIVGGKINNDVKDLQTTVNADCNVDFVDLTSDDGLRIFQRSLAFVMVTATRDLFPEGEVTVEHSLSKGLYCELSLGREVTAADVEKLQQRMAEIIAEDRQFSPQKPAAGRSHRPVRGRRPAGKGAPPQPAEAGEPQHLLLRRQVRLFLRHHDPPAPAI